MGYFRPKHPDYISKANLAIQNDTQLDRDQKGTYTSVFQKRRQLLKYPNPTTLVICLVANFD